ncbi:MAG: alpha/beta hydrolase [Actinobacteria bacterium]|nr:alpha/beta hydrolase [Actinomycetota bacterium]
MQDNTLELSDGRTLGFADYGRPDAVPVMLFHGTPGSRVYGLDDDHLLDKFGVRVVCPERPGYGLSDPDPGRTIRDWAADVKELADHLGLGRLHLAGESGGEWDPDENSLDTPVVHTTFHVEVEKLLKGTPKWGAPVAFRILGGATEPGGGTVLTSSNAPPQCTPPSAQRGR